MSIWLHEPHKINILVIGSSGSENKKLTDSCKSLYTVVCISFSRRTVYVIIDMSNTKLGIRKVFWINFSQVIDPQSTNFIPTLTLVHIDRLHKSDDNVADYTKK